MSAYITVAMPILDVECLVDAIGDLGVARDAIVVEREPGSSSESVSCTLVRAPSMSFERTATGFRGRAESEVIDAVQRHYAVRLSAKEQRLAVEAREAEDLEARRVAEVALRRLERDRGRLVREQRAAILERARQQGYRVDETRVNGAIRLVLVKRVIA